MINTHFARLKASFADLQTRPLKRRKEQLKALRLFLDEQESAICAALRSDLQKPRFEALTAEIGVLRSEISFVLSKLDVWARARAVPTPLTQFPAMSHYRYEPRGLVLILAPWNFPIQLSLSPLIGALSAGNTVILKPSELAPHCSKLLAEKLHHYLDSAFVQVIEGDQEVSQHLLRQRFDHIFFTGSPAVGRVILEAAAHNMIPTTLELGGKSPCVVDSSASLSQAADRIVWAKFINCGQVCLAPDYILAQESIVSALTEALKSSIIKQYTALPQQSPDYGRIVSKRHTQRLQSLLEGHKIAFGGAIDVEDRFVAPTLIADPPLDSALMQEEIFGPLLPIVPFAHLDDAIALIGERERPLAISVFSNNKSTVDKLKSRSASGAFSINDAVSHVAVPALPFGGVGYSGMGTYHGESSFECFSYKRSSFQKSTLIDLPLRYAPFNKFKERVAGLFLR